MMQKCACLSLTSASYPSLGCLKVVGRFCRAAAIGGVVEAVCLENVAGWACYDRGLDADDIDDAGLAGDRIRRGPGISGTPLAWKPMTGTLSPGRSGLPPVSAHARLCALHRRKTSTSAAAGGRYPGCFWRIPLRRWLSTLLHCAVQPLRDTAPFSVAAPPCPELSKIERCW